MLPPLNPTVQLLTFLTASPWPPCLLPLWCSQWQEPDPCFILRDLHPYPPLTVPYPPTNQQLLDPPGKTLDPWMIRCSTSVCPRAQLPRQQHHLWMPWRPTSEAQITTLGPAVTLGGTCLVLMGSCETWFRMKLFLCDRSCFRHLLAGQGNKEHEFNNNNWQPQPILKENCVIENNIILLRNNHVECKCNRDLSETCSYQGYHFCIVKKRWPLGKKVHTFRKLSRKSVISRAF